FAFDGGGADFPAYRVERIGHLRRAKDVVDLQAAMKPLGTFGPTGRGRDFAFNSRHERTSCSIITRIKGHPCPICVPRLLRRGQHVPMVPSRTSWPPTTIGFGGGQL